MTHPKLVPIRLRDIGLDEEFVTSISKEPGRLIARGYVLDVNPGGPKLKRCHAVLCRFGTEDRVYSADMIVRVEFDRAHKRLPAEYMAEQWNQPLPEPVSPARAAQREKRLTAPMPERVM